MPNGQYQIKVLAIDNAGNLADNISGWFTIDNTLPALHLTKPQSGYIYILDKKIVPTLSEKTVILGKITVSLLVEAFLGIKKIEFYVDGIQKEILYNPPYEWIIPMPLLGRHNVDVILYDQLDRTAAVSFEAIFFSR